MEVDDATADAGEQIAEAECVNKCKAQTAARKNVRRSDRVAGQAAAKAAKAASELAMKAWNEEVKAVKKQAKQTREAISAMIRQRFEGASYDELELDAQKARNAGQDDAAEVLEEMKREQEEEMMGEEVKDDVAIERLVKLLNNAPVGERGTEVVQTALADLKEMGVDFEFGQSGEVTATRDEKIWKGEKVGPVTEADRQIHHDTYDKWWKGGRRRKTKKNKKSRRKTKRGGSEEDPNAPIQPPPKKKTKPNPPPAPPAAPVEQPDVKMAGRRKTKRSRRTTRR
jgi:hypothetical protein